MLRLNLFMSSSSSGYSFSYNNEVEGQVVVSRSTVCWINLQIKRIHQNWRQLLHVISCFWLYEVFRLKTDSDLDATICQWFRVFSQNKSLFVFVFQSIYYTAWMICFFFFFDKYSLNDMLHNLLWVLNPQPSSPSHSYREGGAIWARAHWQKVVSF